MHSLDEILDVLERYRVRATYGAVGKLTGQPASFLMNGLKRSPRYSWIVNQETHQPTGYSAEEKHPELEKHSMVLDTPTKLRDWLQRKAAKPTP